MMSRTVDLSGLHDGCRDLKAVKCEWFDSVREMIAVTESRPRINPSRLVDCVRGEDDKRCVEDDEWTLGVASYRDAVRMAEDGWQEPVAGAASRLRRMPMVPERRTMTVCSVAGYAPVVPLAIQGVPNCMLDTRRDTRPRIIDLYYDYGASSYTPAKALHEIAVMVLAEVQRLERIGFRVRISACHFQFDDCGYATFVSAKVKGENEPMDLKRIMFPLTHPAFFRLIEFGWQDRAEHLNPDRRYRPVTRGHGIYTMEDEEWRAIIARVLPRGAVLLCGGRMAGWARTSEEMERAKEEIADRLAEGFA